MPDLPIIYVPPASRYTNRTSVIRPIISPALRVLAILGVEWTTLKFIEDAPLLIRVSTFVISALVLAVIEQQDWLRFKGQAYFPTIILSLLLVYCSIVGYSYFSFETANSIQSIATNDEEVRKVTLIEWLRQAQQERNQLEQQARVFMLQRNIGPINLLNALQAAGALWSHLLPGTAILISSSDQDNIPLRDNLLNILSVGVQVAKTGKPWKVLLPPNYENTIDAPRLPSSNTSGIIIHALEQVTDSSDNQVNALLKQLFSCFTMRFASTTADGLAEFYHEPKVLWIEVGVGWPWRPPQRGERWTCQE